MPKQDNIFIIGDMWQSKKYPDQYHIAFARMLDEGPNKGKWIAIIQYAPVIDISRQTYYAQDKEGEHWMNYRSLDQPPYFETAAEALTVANRQLQRFRISDPI